MRRGRAVAGLALLIGLTLIAPNLPAVARLGHRVVVDQSVLADIAGGGRTSVVVLLTAQADLGAAHGLRDGRQRGRFVHQALTEHATRTQAPLQRWLDARGVGFQSFWVANMLVLDADRALVEELAARADVARIDSNRPSRGIEEPAIADAAAAPALADALEPGVGSVNAPAAWQLGYEGQGIVVGSSDTGVRWTHTALRSAYRGWNGSTANHNYNWHDAVHSGGGVCGANTVAPCDDNGHGTHTVGTMTGDDGASNTIGVAPGAKWIGCRSMDQGNGTPASYSECFQFFLAPTDLAGNNANPDLRPHVVNNSWVCTAGEGCTSGAELEVIVNNLVAAGIFVVDSAGNGGPTCGSVSNAPATYAAAFSVGAIDASNNQLASFSSRGPSNFYSPPLMKPELSAPGVNVRSATRSSDSAYATLSGTSMAAPHVSGVVALLWSARPELVRDIPATRGVLLASANSDVVVDPPERCGETNSWNVPNNSFGHGRVDALVALNQPTPTPTPVPTPTLAPTITPGATPTPPPPNVPGPPTSVVAAAGDASANVSWSAPESGGGPQVSGYTATSNPGGRTCSTSGALACPVGGLTNGVSYTFTVVATNVAGDGPPSAPSNSVTPQALDTTAPTPSVPKAAVVFPQAIGSTVAVRVRWTAASDPSGIARYDLLRSTNGNPWQPVALSSPTATSAILALSPGNYYRFALRATDGAGNSSGYATTSSAKLVRAQETATGVTYSGTWKRVAASGASGGYVRKSGSAGARATYTFSGTSIGFVSALGPGRGIAEIWLDGSRVATVDLYAATVRTARVVWAATVAGGSHSLEVRVTGQRNPASTGFRVDVDAFVRWN